MYLAEKLGLLPQRTTVITSLVRFPARIYIDDTVSLHRPLYRWNIAYLVGGRVHRLFGFYTLFGTTSTSKRTVCGRQSRFQKISLHFRTSIHICTRYTWLCRELLFFVRKPTAGIVRQLARPKKKKKIAIPCPGDLNLPRCCYCFTKRGNVCF